MNCPTEIPEIDIPRHRHTTAKCKMTHKNRISNSCEINVSVTHTTCQHTGSGLTKMEAPHASQRICAQRQYIQFAAAQRQHQFIGGNESNLCSVQTDLHTILGLWNKIEQTQVNNMSLSLSLSLNGRCDAHLMGNSCYGQQYCSGSHRTAAHFDSNKSTSSWRR